MAPQTDTQLTKGERVRKLRLFLNLNQTEFGKAISRNGTPVSQNYLSAIEGGRETMGSDVQTRIEARWNVRKQWLDEGIGEMLSADLDEPLSEAQATRIRTALGTAPKLNNKGGNLLWVPVRERGLFLRTQGNGSSLRRYNLPVLGDAGYAFEVGESAMLPAYAPGSFVITTRLDAPLDMVIGSPYVVQTEDLLLIAQFAGQAEGIYRFSFTNAPGEVALPDADILYVYHIEFKLAKP